MNQKGSRSSLFFASLLFLVAGVPSLHGADAKETEHVTRVRYLIELLASKNTAPIVDGDARHGDDQTITFPKNYDRSFQVTVYLAIKELLAEDEFAIDLLLSHKNDDRYSFSINSYKDYNVSVTRACAWIAEGKALCYEPDIHVITRSQFGLYPRLDAFGSKDAWEAWWNKNRHRGLAALQMEAIDAQIKFQQEVDGKTALPWHAEASPLPIDEFNRLRDDNLRILKAIRQYVAETRVPFRPRTLAEQYRYFFGLPWTGRRHNI